jgi:hypothetical protein
MDSGPRDAGAAGARPWPEGFRAAVALTYDVDAESVMLASDPSLAARASLMSHQRYAKRSLSTGRSGSPHVRDRGPGNGGNRCRAGDRLR